jgi:hypothetical protein
MIILSDSRPGSLLSTEISNRLIGRGATIDDPFFWIKPYHNDADIRSHKFIHARTRYIYAHTVVAVLVLASDTKTFAGILHGVLKHTRSHKFIHARTRSRF